MRFSTADRRSRVCPPSPFTESLHAFAPARPFGRFAPLEAIAMCGTRLLFALGRSLSPSFRLQATA